MRRMPHFRIAILRPVLTVLLFLSVIVSTRFSPVLSATPGGSPVRVPVISEIMFNPDGDENAREYVELFNLSGEPVSIEGYLIGDGTGYDEIIPAQDGGWIVPPGAYALILDPDYFDTGDPYEAIPLNTPLFTVSDKAIGSRGLSNSVAEHVSLISGAGDTLSAVTYSLDCPPGHSWERIRAESDDAMSNFGPSREPGGTPGQLNSVTPPAYNPALDETSLRFVPSDPRMGDTLKMAVSYRNAGSEAVSEVDVAIFLLPGIHVGTVTFSASVEPGTVSPEETLSLDCVPGGRLSFSAYVVSVGSAMSAADDTVYISLDVPVAPCTVILNEVMAAPADGAPEWIEVMNTASCPVDLFTWCVRDSKREDGIVQEHVFIKEDGLAVLAGEPLAVSLPEDAVYAAVERFPALNNDGDSVTLHDHRGAFQDSMSYENILKGMSLERISYRQAGSIADWDASVDSSGSTPGNRNSISFSPSEKGEKVALTVSPNPFLSQTTITYELTFPVARVSLYLYDRRGRIVTRLKDAEESGSIWSCTWNGKNKGSRLPAGPYILSLEALDKRTGRVVTDRKTVVLASPL